MYDIIFALLSQIDMLGKDVYEFVYDKDKVELKKQFVDKYQGSKVHGMGLNTSGKAIEMNIRCANITGEFTILPYWMKMFMEFNLAFSHRLVKFMELPITEFLFLWIPNM